MQHQVLPLQQDVQVGIDLTATAPGAAEIYAHDELLLGRDKLVNYVGKLIAEQSCNSTGWTVHANDANVIHPS